jgi:hypothetical protein
VRAGCEAEKDRATSDRVLLAPSAALLANILNSSE